MVRVFWKSLLLGLMALALAAGGLAWFANRPLELPASPLEFHVKAGSSLRAAAGQIADAGVRVAPQWFALLGRLLGKSGQIKAGSYEVHAGITPLQLLDKLTRGDVALGEVRFIEGWTFRQVRAALDANTALRHDTLGLDERQILARIGAQEGNAEGLFFPDTYLFDRNSSDSDVLRRAYQAMRRRLDGEWAARDSSVPVKTPYEALILASLVEKETGTPEDRPLIAAVFANRLRQGMMLQTDPSVIYGLGESFDGNLRKRDLQQDTPYNTYTRTGLPPTPIAAPGLASLRAALHPAQTDVLYFVAKGDGQSHFSRNLDEHNRAVARYQKKGQ